MGNHLEYNSSFCKSKKNTSGSQYFFYKHLILID
jgi:hypothetical protein